MKKLLIIFSLLLIVGCNKVENTKEQEKDVVDKNRLVCTKFDESGKGTTEFTFKDEVAVNIKTSIEFKKEVDAEAVCELYKSLALEDIKVTCNGNIVSMESNKLAEEHQGKKRKELKQELEEENYTCK